MSYIKQHTEFLSQDWQQCKDWAMMLANSTNPKREGKTKKKEKTKIRKKKKERNKKRGRNTRETTHNTFRAWSFEDKVGFGKLPKVVIKLQTILRQEAVMTTAISKFGKIWNLRIHMRHANPINTCIFRLLAEPKHKANSCKCACFTSPVSANFMLVATCLWVSALLEEHLKFCYKNHTCFLDLWRSLCKFQR